MAKSPNDKAPMNYKSAGLDLELYEQTIDAMAPLVKRTHTPRVMGGFGGFASLFSLDFNNRLFARNYKHPVLVTCNDGVGTKLKIASMMQKYDTVGIDLVAMSVNDCLCTGAEPVVFLDYLAMPKDDIKLATSLIKGISDGCIDAGCALTGGETAILPDFYAPGDYDLAGFCVGIVERDSIINGNGTRPGDLIIGLSSSGLHSNGYSLARKIVFEKAGLKIDDSIPELGATVGQALLEPTRIYCKPILDVLRNYPVKRRVVRGLAHITGEGLEGNVPRSLPANRRAIIKKDSWPKPAVFPWLKNLGNVDEKEMYTVFNMGIGFVMIVSRFFAKSIVKQLNEAEVPSWVIGEIVEGETGVDLV